MLIHMPHLNVAVPPWHLAVAAPPKPQNQFAVRHVLAALSGRAVAQQVGVHPLLEARPLRNALELASQATSRNGIAQVVATVE